MWLNTYVVSFFLLWIVFIPGQVNSDTENQVGSSGSVEAAERFFNLFKSKSKKSPPKKTPPKPPKTKPSSKPDKPSKYDKTKKDKSNKESFFEKLGGGFGSGPGKATSILGAAGAGILLGGVMAGAGEKLAWIFAGLVVVGVLLVAVFLFWRVKMLRNMLSCGSDDDYDDDYYEEYEDYDSD